MDDFRAKVGELSRLLIGDVFKHNGFRHEPGIRAQDSVNIGPDRDRAGFRSFPKMEAENRFHFA